MLFIILGRTASRRLAQPSKTELPSFWSDEGNSNSARFLQSLKALLSMVFTDDGMVTDVSDVQLRKVFELMSSRLPCSVALVNDEQFLKAPLPSFDSLSIVMVVRLLQSSKALLPTLLTDSISIVVRARQLSKAELPISSTASGKSIDDKLLQSRKASLPITESPWGRVTDFRL